MSHLQELLRMRQVEEDIIKLGKVNAPTWEIADHISESSDQMFTTIDVRKVGR